MLLGKIRLYLRITLVKVLQRLGLHSEVYYVGSSEALPPPLSTDEESYLIGKLESGDGAVRTVLIRKKPAPGGIYSPQV